MRIVVRFHDGTNEVTTIESDSAGFWNLSAIDAFFRFDHSDTVRLFKDSNDLESNSYGLKEIDGDIHGSMSGLIHLLSKRKEVLEYVGCYPETSGLILEKSHEFY